MESLPNELFVKIINPEPCVDITQFMVCRDWYHIAVYEMNRRHKLNRKNHIRMFSDCLGEINSIRYKIDNINTSLRQYRNIATIYIYKRNIYNANFTHVWYDRLDVLTTHYMYGTFATKFPPLKNESERSMLKRVFKQEKCDVKYKIGCTNGLKNNNQQLFYKLHRMKSIQEILYHDYFRVIEK
ncbi:Hypothetical protein PACV_423 [Pacmanvirus A23]|uniref:Hypothetical protein n=1 Tax=Pacmanvirus A23 TaxID=1932881 RepID=UPI000A093A36|nr:Hypothetical protein B9W72_gp419 [Pacmanvirus A23]SIP86136.1 Hypothetical protein PACV_423 [Pacmanvirus A23]